MNAAEAVSSILEHHGIRGMKWGIRKDRSRSVSVSSKGKKLKSTGGHGHPAHPDAISARKTGQIAKKSGVKSLSNDQLKSYSNRLNLEQSVKRLQYGEKNAAQKAVAKMLGRAGDQGVDKVVNEGTKKIGILLAAAA